MKYVKLKKKKKRPHWYQNCVLVGERLTLHVLQYKSMTHFYGVTWSWSSEFSGPDELSEEPRAGEKGDCELGQARSPS